MTDRHEDARVGAVPFWAHQVAEMLVGVVLMIEGARTGQHTAVLFGMGAALLVLSLISDGALGAWPLVSRRVHRVLDLVAAALLALSPIVLSLEGVLAIVVLEAAALGMVWLAIRTNWPPPSRLATPPPSQPTRPSQPSPAPGPAPTPEPPVARRLGAAVGKARDDGPRQVGRIVGRAKRRLRSPQDPPSPDANP